MPDTLDRLAGPAAVASGASTVFTGTGGHIYTIKSMEITNTSGASRSFSMGVGGVAAADLIANSITLDAGDTAEFEGILVLEGAETLEMNASGAGLTITISGLDQS